MARSVDTTQQILLDQIRDAVVILDARQPNLPLLALNRAYRELFSPEAAPHPGAGWDSALSSTASAMIAPRLQTVLAEGIPQRVKGVPLTSANSHRTTAQLTYWDWQSQPTHGVDGTIEQIVVTMTDVTAQQFEPIEMASADAARALKTLIDGLVEGIFILDQHGAILAANRVGVQLLNIAGDPRARQFSEQLRASAARRSDGQAFEPLVDFAAPVLAGRPVTIERLFIGEATAGGDKRRVTLSGEPIGGRSDRISGAIIFVHDNGAQRQTNQEKDTFLSMISHEIRSPLTSIKGFAQLAVRAIENDEESQQRATKHLRVIQQQADRISSLISDLSDVARMQRGELQLEQTVFDLVPIIRNAVEQQQLRLSSHQIALQLPDDPLIVRADPQRIRQLLGSLLSNAAKASPLATHIEVTVGCQDKGIYVAVRDFGIGISPEEQSRVFERFYRTAEGGGSGLGLGLYIAQQIAFHSDGTLTVESEPGVGSIFRLDLPLAQHDDLHDDE